MLLIKKRIMFFDNWNAKHFRYSHVSSVVTAYYCLTIFSKNMASSVVTYKK